MFVETSLRELPMPQVPEAARLAEDLGFDGLTFSEVRHDPFVVAAVAAAATSRIQLATSVAIAFPRSPMVVAQATHNLQELSSGRFSVGLGTQVKGHINGQVLHQRSAQRPRAQARGPCRSARRDRVQFRSRQLASGRGGGLLALQGARQVQGRLHLAR